jgi:hypothetical protein
MESCTPKEQRMIFQILMAAQLEALKALNDEELVEYYEAVFEELEGPLVIEDD